MNTIMKPCHPSTSLLSTRTEGPPAESVSIQDMHAVHWSMTGDLGTHHALQPDAAHPELVNGEGREVVADLQVSR